MKCACVLIRNNHVRSSSFCKFVYQNSECFGSIRKFVEYKSNIYFLADLYKESKNIYNFYDFNEENLKILKANEFEEYFRVFDNIITDTVISRMEDLINVCIKIKINNSFFFITDVLEDEHD